MLGLYQMSKPPSMNGKRIEELCSTTRGFIPMPVSTLGKVWSIRLACASNGGSSHQHGLSHRPHRCARAGVAHACGSGLERAVHAETLFAPAPPFAAVGVRFAAMALTSLASPTFVTSFGTDGSLADGGPCECAVGWAWIISMDIPFVCNLHTGTACTVTEKCVYKRNRVPLVHAPFPKRQKKKQYFLRFFLLSG